MREEDKRLAESLEKELQSLVQRMEEPDTDFENRENKKPPFDFEQQPQIAEDASEEAIDRAMDKIIEDTIGNIPTYDEETYGEDNEEEDDGDEEAEDASDGLRRAVIGTAIALGAAILVVGGLYSWKAFSYRDRFFNNTIINEVDCSNLTVVEAEQLIKDKLENYELTIQFRGEQSAVITGADIDYRYVSDGRVQKIKEKQNPVLWIKGWFSQSEYTVGEEIQYEEEKLQEKLDSLTELDSLQMVAPEDAYLKFSENAFVIVDEVQGNTLKKDALYETVKNAVSEGIETLNLEELDLYENPVVLRDDPDLLAKVENLNQLVKGSVTYQLPGGESLVLDGNTLIKWLEVDSEGNYSKSDESYRKHLSDFVDELAAKVDTLGGTRKFRAHDGSVIDVKGGSYGWKINKEKEIEALTQNLSGNEAVTREPEYSSTERGTENSGLGGHYVEINLTKQHLWLYKNGREVFDTPIVSGRLTTRRYTPGGTYYITEMVRNKTLVGQTMSNGQPEYRTPVAYWMRFNGGIGLHDATWQSSFGGERYLWAGSHGCINLPLNAAKTIYELIEKGTPVICYYTHQFNLTEEGPPTPKPTVTPKPSLTPQETVTPEPTSTPQTTVTPEPTSTPQTTVTPEPTATPETTATPEPTPEATAAPETALVQ